MRRCWLRVLGLYWGQEEVLVNSFMGNSVILRHSCPTAATLLIHCKLHFRSQEHIFQRKSLLACQIHWIVLQKHFLTTWKHVFRSIPQIGFARERVKDQDCTGGMKRCWLRILMLYWGHKKVLVKGTRTIQGA